MIEYRNDRKPMREANAKALAEAKKAGFNAAVNGKKPHECPHIESSAAGNAWLKGYERGRGVTGNLNGTLDMTDMWQEIDRDVAAWDSCYPRDSTDINSN